MTRKWKYAISILLIMVWSCHAAESPPDEWAVSEPEASEPAWDCPSIDEQEPWVAEEAFFILYRYLACRRGETENLVFSPVAIYIALVEMAVELGDSEAQSIAEQYELARAGLAIVQSQGS